MRPHRTHAPRRHPRWRTATLPSAAVALVGAWISGCSVLYDLSTEQCSVDADCAALGAGFEGLACVEHICQTPPGCQSSAECIDDHGNGNAPWACIDRECVDLITPECPEVLPVVDDLWLENLRTENPLIIAGMNTNGTYDRLFRNYDLALKDFHSNGPLDGGKRGLVMLGCKGAVADTDELDAMMTHLTQTVKVPAIVSSLSAENMQYAFQNYTQAAQTFVMSAQESDPTLSTLGDSGLLWHVVAGADSISQPYAPLLTRVLAHLGLTADVRVAVVEASDERFLANTRAALTAAPESYGLRFNGTTVAENIRTEHYKGLQVTLNEESSLQQVQDLLAFKPHVIISAAGREFLTNIITGVEANWDGAQPKPFYILSAYNYNDSDGLSVALAGNAGLQARLAGVGVAAAEDTTNYDNYLVAYQATFNVVEPGFENYYDAAYYTLYSAAAMVGDDPLRNGLAFPAGMRRLLGGNGTTPYNVGPTDIPFALQALAVGGNIQLNGTMGPPVWNQNGTRNMPGSVYCIDTNNNYRPDVLRYQEGADPTAATLVGDFPCFSGF